MQPHIQKQCKAVLGAMPGTAVELKARTGLPHSTLHKRLRLMMGSEVYIFDYKYPGGAPVYAAGTDMPSKTRAIHSSEEEALARKKAAQKRKSERKAELKALKLVEVQEVNRPTESSRWATLYGAFGSQLRL
jgi:hypothetical protein